LGGFTMILGEYIEKTLRVRTEAALFEALSGFLGERGLEVWSYHVLVEHLVGLNMHQGFITNSFPEDWVRHYIENRYYLCDPIINFARRATEPYRWWDIDKLATLSEAEARYVADAKTWLKDGYGIPVCGSIGTVAYFGAGSLSHHVDLPLGELIKIQFACHQTHMRFLQLHGAVEVPPATLTPREIDVLTWVVRGKSNSVIAEVLGISEHTVDTLMRRIYRKLGVGDRTSAALRAVGSGLIVL
jgi:DNA-binding CsgD family transcriptional regulator